MKTYAISILLLFGLIFSMPIYADNGCDEDYDIELTESDDDSRIRPADPKGKRSAPMLTQCTISYNNGVTIHSEDGTIDIISYEIWGIDGETCLGVYNDERMFLDALYSSKGEYIVVFTTADKKYTGYIWLD